MRMPIIDRALVGLIFVSSLALPACRQDPAEEDTRCQGLLAGDLVITELMTDPAGTDTGNEYFEIYNASSKGIPLKGLTLYKAEADGSGKKQHRVIESTLELPPGSYTTVGDFRGEGEEPKLPAHLHYSYGDSLSSLGNAAGLVGIVCGETVVDEVKWVEVKSNSGHALELDGKLAPDSAVNDLVTNFCQSEQQYNDVIFGSPGSPNAACGSPALSLTECVGSDGSRRPVLLPTDGDLVITEIMANPSGADTEREWVEVYARTSVDLNGLTLSQDKKSTQLKADSCIHLPARSYAVLARNPDSALNGGLSLSVVGLFKFDLGNAGGALSLRNGEAIVDEARYGVAQDGVSWQLEPSRLDAASNDTEGNFCPAQTPWQSKPGETVDLGSPGSANEVCANSLPPGTCLDGTSGNPRPILKPSKGQLVITEFLANPKGVDNDQEWFEVLVTADVDLNGVEILYDSVSKQTLSSAECIRTGAGSLIVFARSLDATLNGGLPEKLQGRFTFLLGNTGAHALALAQNGELLDSFPYTGVATGAGADGVSWQLSSTKLDPDSNDVAANTCLAAAASTYGTNANRGTPGAANTPCP